MQVYGLPKEIKAPEYDYTLNNWREVDEKFYSELKQWLITNNYTGEYSGEVISFGVADGGAFYMIAQNAKKMLLIHCPIGDAYSLPDWQLKGFTKAMAIKRIKSEKSMQEIFSNKKK